MQQAFTPKSIQALAPRIGELVDGMLDRIAEEGGADLAPALASPPPFTVIADMLGAPPTDHERIRNSSGTLVRPGPVADPAASCRRSRTRTPNWPVLTAEMIASEAAQPRRRPSTAPHRRGGRRKLSDRRTGRADSAALHQRATTTVNLLANGTLALLRHPE
ncbi:cytochrome P450 [Streptomyces thinghirensis]|nr:cytochrome P450 [Streptomyces thinghirensis]